MRDAEACAGLPFAKMHGLGNDFMVIDARAEKDGGAGAVPDLDAGTGGLAPGLVRALADRHRGVGFDQLAVIEPGRGLRVAFYNADGSRSAACGNATRCIADREMRRLGRDRLEVEVAGRGTLAAERRQDGTVSVNMGRPQLDWREIPLSGEADLLALPIDGSPVATGMGNPHCTFFVEDAEAVDLAALGAATERHPLFPERTNVQVAQVLGRDRIRVRVWERGAGITLASGSSSCAAVVAASRKGLADRRARVELDGGAVAVDWREDGVWLSGPTAHVFDGALAPGFASAGAEGDGG